MNLLSPFRQAIQRSLFPILEEERGPLTHKQQELIAMLEVAQIEKCIRRHISGYPGRPQNNRRFIARDADVGRSIDSKGNKGSWRGSE